MNRIDEILKAREKSFLCYYTYKQNIHHHFLFYLEFYNYFHY